MSTSVANDRIVVDPAILLGKPVIRGTRVPVSLIVNYIDHGHAIEEILDDYPNLTRADVEAAIAYHKTQTDRIEVRAL